MKKDNLKLKLNKTRKKVKDLKNKLVLSKVQIDLLKNALPPDPR